MRLLPKAGLVVVSCLALFLVGCNETFRPIANPIPLPGGDPLTFDIVAVINQNPADSVPSTLQFLDVSGDTNVGNRQIGVNPVYGVWDASGTIVVTASTFMDSLTAVSPSSVAVATVTLEQGSKPVFLGGKQSGTMFVINSAPTSGSGTSCSSPAAPSVGFLLTSNLTLNKTVCLDAGSQPVWLAQSSDAARLMVVDKAQNQVWFLNTSTGAVLGKVTVGSSPIVALESHDRSLVYVLNQGSDDITVIDVATLTTVGSAVSTQGTNPVYMALDNKLNRLYVVNRGSSSATVFDGNNSTLPVVKQGIPLGASPETVAILPDSSAAFVANTGANTVTRISGLNFAATDIVVSTTAGATVTSVASSKDSSRVYATVTEPTTLKNGTAIIRTNDNKVVTFQASPQQDLNCDSTKTTCPLQVPFQVVSRN